MKVLITGNYGLGKNIKETLIEVGHEVLCISTKNDIQNIINDYDVFINNEYIDKIQTDLFELVYNEWKYKPKTIVNILTSAIIFGGPNQKYIDDKKDLEKRTFELRDDSKKVRIINIYPNTLESSKLAKNQKLNYTDVSNIIKYVIELPQDIEIFQIGISKTTLEIKKSII
jgi:NADP-dependent 3-hydroxy acid dehydrogenase YdfG